MGNLIAAAAVANDVCRFHNNNLMKAHVGSKTANFAIDQCKSNAKGMIRDHLDAWDLCPIPAAIALLVHERSADANDVLQSNFTAARAVNVKYVTHTACGTSPSGLKLTSQFLYQTLESTVTRRVTTVSWTLKAGCPDSTRVSLDPITQAGSTTAAINHGDLKFKWADDTTNVAQRPQKWFQCLL
ncbi:Aste57867_16900 [Aphanomyces stellatus]|uniref:Aste57867_16900 protein n=1 Tax=Aphanomyces stellatus TaxID=120398 RepID=A0A485L7A4_9STRA|nr:hypothetical protein As57867_016842 [Aphanomyces stellatus]VFT93663.1 Aste57867_16900 [Aphanomyces stellatus]